MSLKPHRRRRYCRACHRGISRSARTCPICLKLNLKLVDYILLAVFAAACAAVAAWAMQDWASYYRDDHRRISADRVEITSRHSRLHQERSGHTCRVLAPTAFFRHVNLLAPVGGNVDLLRVVDRDRGHVAA